MNVDPTSLTTKQMVPEISKVPPLQQTATVETRASSAPKLKAVMVALEESSRFRSEATISLPGRVISI